MTPTGQKVLLAAIARLFVICALGTSRAEAGDAGVYPGHGMPPGTASLPSDPCYDMSGTSYDDMGATSGGGWAESCDAGCPKNCCPVSSICEAPHPQWTLRADGLIMERGRPDSAVLIVNPADPSENLNASDFNFDYDAGWDIALTRHNLIWDSDVEVRYFSIDSWTAGAAGSFSGPITQINTNPPRTLFGPRDVTSLYGSDLRSLEVNLRRPSGDGWWTWIAGFRYLELDEQLDTLLVDPGAVLEDITAEINTRNRLYGFQIGGETYLWGNGRFCLEGFVIGGIYGNAAAQGSTLTESTGPPTVFTRSDQQGQTAFVGETGLAAKYHYNDWLALRADYRVLFVEGVALATDQVPFAFSGVDSSGGTLYHGLFLGLEGRF
jgi:hypothetical protein